MFLFLFVVGGVGLFLRVLGGVFFCLFFSFQFSFFLSQNILCLLLGFLFVSLFILGGFVCVFVFVFVVYVYVVCFVCLLLGCWFFVCGFWGYFCLVLYSICLIVCFVVVVVFVFWGLFSNSRHFGSVTKLGKPKLKSYLTQSHVFLLYISVSASRVQPDTG